MVNTEDIDCITCRQFHLKIQPHFKQADVTGLYYFAESTVITGWLSANDNAVGARSLKSIPEPVKLGNRVVDGRRMQRYFFSVRRCDARR